MTIMCSIKYFKSKSLGTKKSHSTSRDQKNHATSWDKKITQHLGIKKITQPLATKNVLKTQVLVTNKIQEIGIDHLGLVCTNFMFFLSLNILQS